MGTPMRKKITLSQELLERALGAVFMHQQYLDLHRKGDIVHSIVYALNCSLLNIKTDYMCC